MLTHTMTEKTKEGKDEEACINQKYKQNHQQVHPEHFSILCLILQDFEL